MSDLATREELEKHMDEPARRYAETHDEEIKAEIEASLIEGSLVLTDNSVP